MHLRASQICSDSMQICEAGNATYTILWRKSISIFPSRGNSREMLRGAWTDRKVETEQRKLRHRPHKGIDSVLEWQYGYGIFSIEYMR
jgi:hypothetical protein